MFSVYILYSPSASKYYIGQTSDLDQRIQSHNVNSSNSYTSKFRPWVLKCAMEVDTRAKAIRIERYLKKKPRIFIERVIDEKELVDYILKRFK